MSKLKKVAVFSTSFVPYSQTFIYDEVTNHSKYEVDVFTKSYTNQSLFPFSRVIYPKSRFGQFFYLNRTYWPGFNKHFKQNDYSLIHAHFGTGAVYAMNYKLKYDLPMVITFHGNDISTLMGNHFKGINKLRYINRSKLILQKAERLLCVSFELAEILKDITGRNDIYIHKLGIDTHKFSPKTSYTPFEDRPIKLLLIGRFTQKKGHIYALRAVQELLANQVPVQLEFIGSGELEAALKNYVFHNNLDKNVIFSGVMSSDAVSQKIKETDVVLVPSIVADNFDREGSPTTVKEAGASGVPVIGTYHAGISETIVDGKTGFLVPERHVKELANRVTTLYNNPALIEEMGKNARQKMVLEFDLKKQVYELELHYDAIAKR